ncbi:hypothetical protein D9R08_14895 [Rhodophyticola porphyridii]|uniref:Uncharacterized protein n=1 Tax=Rhodophyticola porphyridii TaxID=1852017 RepID=A0A3L9XY80_9RHOB|nr:hypothetical protein D9R08_14895 [Rhodophyticola porphyridii]
MHDFLPKENRDDVVEVKRSRVPRLGDDERPYLEHYVIRMPRYYWRLLDWMQEKRGMGASFIFHHCDVVKFQKWEKISEFFMFFIDDWIKKENDLRRVFNSVNT